MKRTMQKITNKPRKKYAIIHRRRAGVPDSFRLIPRISKRICLKVVSKT